MNPLRLRAENYRTFRDLDLALPTGCVGVLGQNGAGKSSIVNAIDVALFGPETRTLAPYLSEDALPGETLLIELELEHCGDLYRIRRTYSASGRGKTTLDFAHRRVQDDLGIGVFTDHGWEPLTQGDMKDTQALIEQTLGMTRATFRASTMLAQGEGSSFCDATPKDRKGILFDALGLGIWDEARDLAVTDRKHREHHLANLDGRIGFLAEQAGQHDELAETVSVLDDRSVGAALAVVEQEQKVKDARERHEKLQARQQAADKARAELAAARAEHAALAREQQTALDARAQAAMLEQDLPALRARADQQTATEAERETLEEQRREQAAKRAETTALAAELQSVINSRKRAHEARGQATEQHTAALERIEGLRSGTTRKCDRCHQTVGGEHREHAIESNQKEAADHAARAKRAEAEETELAATEQEIRARLDQAGQDTDAGLEERYAALTARLRELAGAREKLAAAAERLEGLKTQAAIRDTFEAEIDEAAAKAIQCEALLKEAGEPEPGAVEKAARDLTEAVRAVDVARVEAQRLAVELAQARTRLETVEQANAEHAAAIGERDRLQADLDELRLLERAFGRDGVPTWILETSAIPSLELEADRLLQALGTDYRVELRTERELKSGGAAETLDVILLTPGGARDYSTFSGGERTRLNLALRLALARLLAHRRGAEQGALLIDEPDYLDEAGNAALIETLRGMESDFERIYLVSHVPTLRDAFDMTMNVTKTDGRSEVVVA